MKDFQDRPPGPGEVRDFAEIDRFELSDFVSVAVDRLVSGELSTGMVVGLTGPWGGGKTFLLNWVEVKLRERISERTIVIRFDPWRVSGRDDLLLYFLQRLSEEISRSDVVEDWKSVIPEKIRQKWDSWRPSWDTFEKATTIFANMQQPGAGELIATVLGQTTEQLFKSVTDKISKHELQVVCIIDDLDRLNDAEIRDVATLVKSVGNISTASYLLAYDPIRVASALSRDGTISGGLHYLEKIVQLQLRIPILQAENLRKLAFDLLEVGEGAEWHGASFSDVQRVMHDLVPRIMWVPRDIIRFANLANLRVAKAKYIHKTDILRFCALETKFPLLPENLSRLLFRCTIDGLSELRRHPEIPIEDGSVILERLLLPDGQATEKAGQFMEERSLLKELFPALSEGGPNRIARPIGRLCYESSLRTLLNYRRAPGLLTACDAKRILEGHEDLGSVLLRAMRNGVARHAHLQLRTSYSADNVSDDAREHFWTALGGHLDYVPSMQTAEHWSEFLDLSHVWVRGVATGFLADPGLDREFIAELVSNMLDDGKIHLSSCFLYFAASAVGRHGLEQKGEFAKLLPAYEVERLLEKAAGVIGNRLARTGSEPVCIKSLYPVWVASSDDASERSVRKSISAPENQAEADRIVALVYRTWRDDRVEGVRIQEFIDRDALLPIIREFSTATIEKPFLLQKAYRFVAEHLGE